MTTVARIEGTITLPNGSTSNFSIEADYGWHQWGASADRLGETGVVLDALVQGLQDGDVEMSDQDPEEIIESPSGWTYKASQENGDGVDCQHCGNTLNDDTMSILTNHDGYAFCSERCILADHDAGEDLHEYVGNSADECIECGDSESGLMHSNTDRDVEPLLYEYAL